MTTQRQLTREAALRLHAQAWQDRKANRISVSELAASRTRALLAGAREADIARIEGRGRGTT